eukprot:jgi/Hompol1/6502/HPOL_003284-RA
MMLSPPPSPPLLPPDAVVSTIVAATPLAAAATAVTAAAQLGVFVVALIDGERPVDLLLAVLWIAAWHPSSAAPRSLALFFLLFAVGQAGSLYHLIDHNESSHPLFIAQIIGLAVSTIGFSFDFINPARNAELISDFKVHNRQVYTQDISSFMSFVSFSWVNPLLKAGKTKPLESEDIPHIARYDQMENVIERWKRIRVKGNNVFWDLLRLTKYYFSFQMSVSVITTVLDFSKPFFINRTLNWIQNRQPGDSWYGGAFLLIGMFVASMIREFLYSQMSLSGRHWGMQLRSVLVYEIFTKSLRRAGTTIRSTSDEEDDGSASQGKIVSLMSNDTNQIRNFITGIDTMLIDTPLSIIISVSGLLILMGPPALAGLVVVILSGPISSMVLTARYKVLKQTRSLQDRRIQVTNEALQGIRIIKYMAWEPQFIKKISDAREDELQSRLRLLFNNLLMGIVAWAASILVTFTSFFFYTVVAGKALDAATAFTSISLLSTVSFTLSNLSEDVSSVLNIRIVMSRIQSFLDEEELERHRIADAPHAANYHSVIPSSSSAIGFLHGEFSYYSQNTDAAFAKSNKKGKDKDSGRKHSRQGSSESLAKGKKPEQTIAPANAPEETHSFYLRDVSVDFPLNKVTAIVGPTGAGKSSLLSALLGELKRISGQVYIPRQTPEANGEVIAAGTPSDIINNPEVDSIVAADIEAESTEYQIKDTGAQVGAAAATSITKKGKRIVDREGKATGSVKFATYIAYVTACGGLMFVFLVFSGFLIQNLSDFLSSWWIQRWTDDVRVGDQAFNSSASLYDASGVRDSLVLSADILSQSFISQSKSLMSSVVAAQQSSSQPSILALVRTTVSEQKDALFYISIYGLISLIELFGLIFRAVTQYLGGLRASRILHRQVLVSVLGSPMRFFETTPVGRIINRFSKDMSDVDMGVMFTVTRFFTMACGSVVRVILVAFVTPPFLVTILFLYFYYRISQFYLLTSRELKRIESVSSSPIYAQFSECLNGVSTIRAYGAEDRIVKQMNRKVDANHRAFFYFAVERVEEYSRLEQEPPAIVDDFRPPENWPSEGKVVVRDLSIKYAPDLPEALKRISFYINPREKLGVVGRTGAGTLRSNLDPLGEHDDAQIWDALRLTNLLESLQKPKEKSRCRSES